MTERISVPAVPNLPRPKDQFDKLYLNQLTNVLRLYFNLLGETELNLAEAIYNLQIGSGGSIIKFPYIAASDSTVQYATAADTPTCQMEYLGSRKWFYFKRWKHGNSQCRWSI